MAADVVIGSRVSPKQKAEMVQWVKSKDENRVTLSIGDGANDVNMISQADVGVGILGKEGAQASKAADFAISEFRHLGILLFLHGREGYRKNSEVMLYMLWKNLLITTPILAFSLFTSCSPQSLLDPILDPMQNIMFSAFPIMWYSITDLQFNKQTLINNQKLFAQGMINKKFNMRVFIKQYISAALTGLLITLTVILAMSNKLSSKYLLFDMFSMGVVTIFAVVIISNMRVLFNSFCINLGSIFLFCFGIISFYSVWYCIDKVPSLPGHGTFQIAYFEILTYLSLSSCAGIFAILINLDDLLEYFTIGDSRILQTDLSLLHSSISERNKQFGKTNSLAYSGPNRCGYLNRYWICIHYW